jgi:hypothetical protein
MSVVRIVLAIVLAAVSTSCLGRRGELMSFEEYARIEHESPYLLRLKRGSGELLYFGCTHLHDPADPQVARIETAWHEFRPTLLLYEGPPHDPPDDLRAAIPTQGEGAVVRRLAARAGIPARSFDPDEATQVAGLRRQGYSSEEVVLWLALRQVVHERRNHSGAALDARMREVFDHYRHVPGLETMPTTIEDFDARVRARFPELTTWRSVPESWLDPAVEPPAWPNAFSRRLQELRDRHMIAQIESALRHDHRVFAIAGSSHVVMQEPALRLF